jgi:hypothetical protein
MAERARKKRRSGSAEAGARPAVAVASEAAPDAAPAHARGPAGAATASAAPEPETGGYYARQRARDEAAREAIEPLAPGERPLALTIAAVAAGLIAIGNLVLLAAGWEVEGREPQATGTALFAALMAAAAIGMWRGRYWAALGFQALLAITVLFAFLALLTAGNWQAVLLSVAIIGAGGTMFWFLVKAMARLQAPQRPPRAPR